MFAYLDMGCDLCVVCDDGISYWQQVQYAQDRGIPVICVNHATSEEPGMVTLTGYINEHIEGVRAQHLLQGCRFELTGDFDTGRSDGRSEVQGLIPGTTHGQRP